MFTGSLDANVVANSLELHSLNWKLEYLSRRSKQRKNNLQQKGIYGKLSNSFAAGA